MRSPPPRIDGTSQWVAEQDTQGTGEAAKTPGPRRRLRDRLVERDGTANPALTVRSALRTQLLLIDDDLREAALGLGAVEQFLADAADLLENEKVTAADLARLAERGDAIDRLEGLSETITSLRRRLLAVASQLR
jgi:hypothetical protein